MKKQLIILAGGKGTRLRSRIGDLPKPLVDIAGKPLLEHQFLLAKQQGFTDILLLIGYGAAAIHEFCGAGERWDLNIRCIEETQPLGTAGAVLAIFDDLADTFMVMYGDTMLNVDLNKIWLTHADNVAEVTLFLHPNDHPHDSDLVDIDANNQVIAFYPYPHNPEIYYPNLVNAALYMMQKKALLPWLKVRDKALDFGKDIFPAMLKNKQKIIGYCSPEYIKDAGTPERLDKVTADYNSGKIKRGSLLTAMPAIFIDRDGTVNQEVNHLKDPAQLELLPQVAAAIRAINLSEYKSVLITNQPVIARGDCDEATLKQIHNKLESLLGKEKAYLDRIYYCPHHPHKGFPGERPELKFVCECRKPAIGMIKKAVQELNIDLSRSWMIGDREVDIQTAYNAGVKSIKVRTGLDENCMPVMHPDFEFYDLKEAVDFILSDYQQKLEIAHALIDETRQGQRIVIGGLARSGKTVWANVLRYALKERGHGAVIISLDGWLRSSEDRPTGGDISTRFNVPAIQNFLANLRNIDKLTQLAVPRYNRMLRTREPQDELIEISPQTVLIFEGVIALLINELNESADYRFYVEYPEALRREIFVREYQLRGYTSTQIEQLYQARESDEVPIIQASRHKANIILNRSASDNQ